MQQAASAGSIDSVQQPRSAIADFEAVVRFHWPRIFRFALASLRDREGAETVTQDCFLRAYRSRHRFRGEASVQTWLMQIAVNLVRDHARNRRLQFWRRARAAADLDGLGEWMADGGSTPEAELMTRERIEAVWNATARLPERQRTVFLLRFVEDMDLLEIAAATGLKEGTVKAHLFRAVQAVRERIGASQ